MAVTRSTAVERERTTRGLARPRVSRGFELMGLLLGTLLIVAGIALVYKAKAPPADTSGLLNLSRLERRDQLLPVLTFLPSPTARQTVAREIFDYVQSVNGKVPNVGAIGRLRIEPPRTNGRVPLLTQAQVAQLKRSVIVRTPNEFWDRLFLWLGAFFTIFYIVHFLWRFRNFSGDQAVLPAVQMLTGIGLILLLSLRDPLRDTLAFADFSQSVIIGAIVMALMVFVDYTRLFSRLSYVPLIGAIILSAALIIFGSGPGTSDAKVNLLGVQPVEFIKILIVFFLAGYFARRWEFLRVLKERRPELASAFRLVDIPRLEYLMPVVAAVLLTLVFFFLQKDLGPALIISCLFLAMYGVARNRALLAVTGIALMLGGFLAGYFLGYPRTVHDRVSMWLSPWDNSVRGGEQVVHALWAMATGGVFGTGLGLGDPNIMPAAHTDLILAVLGEEWGFVGILIVYALYAALIYVGLRIAMRATNDYAFFLALGLTLLVALGAILISGGVLDLVPLSGIVTPFLSYGGTAMLANFMVFAILLSLSVAGVDSEHTRPFRLPGRRLAQVLGAAVLIILGKAAWVQIVRADPMVGAGTLTIQADGFRRYQYNPRLMAIARGIPRGNIYDRNGLPIATSDSNQLEQHKQTFAGIGIDLTQVVNPRDPRHYPLGAPSVHLLGDLRSRANWGARNSSLIERDAMIRLQGYNDRATVVEVPNPRTGKPTYTVRYDFRELVPLLRHKHQPDHPDVVKVTNRERDVRTSIDARLQLRAARILQGRLQKLGREKGAAVVLDSATGDLLASVSYPWPDSMPPELGPDDGVDEMLDRARYGLYPPGSTFKLVTAIAALRKDPANAQVTYECKPLGGGRVGNYVKGWGRPIRDDVADRSAHGTVNMRKGTVVSCNAYYAQLGTYKVGAEVLHATASLLGIAVANPNTPAKLQDALPQAAYGQAQVVASPFQMARVAATIAAGGSMPQGRWIVDETNTRVEQPQPILNTQLAGAIGEYMRGVVTGGTGRSVAGARIAIAGKTGTAELEKNPSHAWFVGFAPYGASTRTLAFAVLVENGQYGGAVAAPIAADIMGAAAELGLFQ
jgi:cell division protein FtsW (lipid II flippase)